MKIRVSYFYQIRNFKPNMIPMSTANMGKKLQSINFIFYIILISKVISII